MTLHHNWTRRKSLRKMQCFIGINVCNSVIIDLFGFLILLNRSENSILTWMTARMGNFSALFCLPDSDDDPNLHCLHFACFAVFLSLVQTSEWECEYFATKATSTTGPVRYRPSPPAGPSTLQNTSTCTCLLLCRRSPYAGLPHRDKYG